MKVETKNWQTKITYANSEEYERWHPVMNTLIMTAMMLVIVIPQVLILWAFYTYGSDLIK